MEDTDSYILLYPNAIRVLVQGGEEFLIPEKMALVDEDDNPIKIPEIDAQDAGKLAYDDDFLEFYIRDTKVCFFITLYNQLKVAINDESPRTAKYRMLYFTELRKLWIGNSVIQFPVYIAEFVKNKLKVMAEDAGVIWIQDTIEIMDDKNNFIQIKREGQNIVIYRNGRFFTTVVHLDYYPQKKSIWTGKLWVDVAKCFINDTAELKKRTDRKLAQIHALFASPNVAFVEKHLCGYPHCNGEHRGVATETRCAARHCNLVFHSNCAALMGRQYRNKECIQCPLHYEQVAATLKIPTFAEHQVDYDLCLRTFPARPALDQSKNLKALKLTARQKKKMQKKWEQSTKKKGILSGAPVTL